MKRILFLILLSATCSQAADPPPPATAEEKLGYALGVDMGKTLRQRRVPLDPASYIRGFIDGIEANRTALNPQELAEIKKAFDEEMARRRQKIREERMKRFRETSVKNLDAATSFLKKNRSKDGVVETESGLQYRVMKPGKGRKPEPGSTVVLHYRGFNANGKEFETTYGGESGPIEASVDKLMKGWREALLQMNEGSKWKLFLPPHLGHGERGNPPVIGPNQLLVFELELVKVK